MGNAEQTGIQAQDQPPEAARGQFNTFGTFLDIFKVLHAAEWFHLFVGNSTRYTSQVVVIVLLSFLECFNLC